MVIKGCDWSMTVGDIIPLVHRKYRPCGPASHLDPEHVTIVSIGGFLDVSSQRGKG